MNQYCPNEHKTRKFMISNGAYRCSVCGYAKHPSPKLDGIGPYSGPDLERQRWQKEVDKQKDK